MPLRETKGRLMSQKQKDIIESEKWFEGSYEEMYAATQHIFDFVQRSKCTIPLDNDNYLDALCYTGVMFKNIKRSMEMLAGPSVGRMIAALETSFREMLARLRGCGGKARLVVAGPNKPENLAAIEARYSDVLKVIDAVPKRTDLRHFLIGDSYMIREEEPHDILEDKTPSDIIKAKVYFYNPAKSKVVESRFNSIWSLLKSRQG